MSAILCRICEKPEIEHHDVQHMYTPVDAHVDTSQFARKRPKQGEQGDDTGATRRIPASYTQTPFDPVLRQALISKGILTIDDLEQAQKEIGALTNWVTGGGVSRDGGEGNARARS